MISYQALRDLCRRSYIYIMPSEALVDLVDDVAVSLDFETSPFEGVESLRLSLGYVVEDQYICEPYYGGR